MPENNDDDLPPRAQPAGPPGETVDLSNPDAEDEPQYSDVPVRPEVQEAIDRYYEEKEQESDEEQQEVDERTPNEFNIDRTEDEEVAAGGTDIQNEDDEPFAEAKSVTRPDDEPKPEPGTEGAEPEPKPEPEPDPEPEHDDIPIEGDPDQDREPEYDPASVDQVKQSYARGEISDLELEEGLEEAIRKEEDDAEDGTDESESTSDISLEGQELGEEVDLDEIDLDSIENQQWGLGKAKPAKIVTMKGMKFCLTEPDDDDAVVNSISKVRRGDLMDAFKALSQLTIEAPTISDERWEQDMTAMERFSLGNIVLQYLDAQDF